MTVPVELMLWLHRGTLDAVLVSLDGVAAHGAWLPRALINVDAEEFGVRAAVRMPEALAREKRLLGRAERGQGDLF